MLESVLFTVPLTFTVAVEICVALFSGLETLALIGATPCDEIARVDNVLALSAFTAFCAVEEIVLDANVLERLPFNAFVAVDATVDALSDFVSAPDIALVPVPDKERDNNVSDVAPDTEFVAVALISNPPSVLFVAPVITDTAAPNNGNG